MHFQVLRQSSEHKLLVNHTYQRIRRGSGPAYNQPLAIGSKANTPIRTYDIDMADSPEFIERYVTAALSRLFYTRPDE